MYGVQLTFEKLRYVFHLRHDVLVEPALFDHPFEDASMGSASTPRQELVHL